MAATDTDVTDPRRTVRFTPPKESNPGMAATRKLSLAALTAISAIAALPAGAQAKADDDRRDQPQAETHATESHDGALKDVTNDQADRGDSKDQGDSNARGNQDPQDNPDAHGNQDPQDNHGNQDNPDAHGNQDNHGHGDGHGNPDTHGHGDDDHAAPQPEPQPNGTPDVVAPTRVADGLLQVVTPRSAVESSRATKAARRGSRRNFRIRIRRGVKVRRAQVWVDGRQVKVTHGVRTTAPVDLRGMPEKTVKVKIRVRTTDGRILEGTRTYKTFGPTRLPGKHNQL